MRRRRYVFGRGALALMAAAAVGLLLSGQGRAAPAPDRGLLMSPSVPAAEPGGDGATPAPAEAARLVAGEMAVSISGLVVEARLRQIFRNDGPARSEAVYLFPLPPDAAVHRMTIRIGERVIEGEIREREAARRVYREAQRSGRRAGLVDQQRPNLFTTRFANIPAGAEVAVELAFQQTARWVDGEYELTLPQVVTRRYTPALSVALDAPEETLWRRFAEDLADRAAIDISQNAGVGDGALRTGGHALDLLVRLQAGAPLAGVASPTHRLAIDRMEGPDGAYLIRFADGPAAATGDVVLRWRPEAADAPGASVFVERREDGVYLLGQILPPARDAALDRAPPRDVTFILDSSGSMHGEPIAQAKRALAQAVDALSPQDRFDVIRFASGYSRLFGATRPADAAARAQALAALARIDADGGTEMAPALASALADAPQAGALRQIVFLTDGAVGNEVDLFALVARDLGPARLFTIGLGPAPNDWFLRKAAEFGRGATLRIADAAQAEARMAAFYRRIAHPALTDIALVSEGDAGVAIRYPARMPDLYRGEPLSFAMRLDRTPDALALTGSENGRPFSVRIEAAAFQEGEGVARLWARQRIAALMDRLPLGAQEPAVREAVLETALAHRLMSRWTSFVAVERSPPAAPSDPAGAQDAAAPDGAARAAAAPQQAMLRIAGPQTALGLDRATALGLALVGLGVGLLLLLRLGGRGVPVRARLSTRLRL